jgi:hypothetical protein
VATPSLTTLLPTLVAPGADSGEIMLPVDGGFGWLIGSAGLGNGGGALAAGGTHITGVIQDSSSTLGGAIGKIGVGGGGDGAGPHAHVDSRAVPSDGGGDNTGFGNFFSAKVAGGSFSPGAVNIFFLLDPIRVETPIRDDLTPLGPTTYTGGQEGLTDKALLCPHNANHGIESESHGRAQRWWHNPRRARPRRQCKLQHPALS